MSSDNGVYILRTVRDRKEEPKGCWVQSDRYYVWRVTHAQAIDNFEWYMRNDPHNLGAYMKDVWGKSPVFMNEQEALVYAHNLAKDIEPLEYGVSNIDTDLKFYGDM